MPEKEKKSFLLRLPQDLYEVLRKWSDDDLRSLNGQIEWILRQAALERDRMREEDSSSKEAS